jgi:hypothetical protein
MSLTKLKKYAAISTAIVHCIYFCNSFSHRLNYLKNSITNFEVHLTVSGMLFEVLVNRIVTRYRLSMVFLHSRLEVAWVS